MHALLLIVLHAALCCATTNSHQENIETLMDNGMDLNPPLQGNQVNILVEEMDGGNYTCHHGHIHCSAPNYRGSFHCTWTRTESRSSAAVLLVKAERNLEKIPCELDADGSGVHCQDVNCPHEEEQHRISLKVYIHSYSRLEVYTKVFYLRDIVTPAKLPNLQSSDGKVFSWNYPDTWEKPCSYFTLQFQVKVVQNGHSCNSEEYIMHKTTEETKYVVNVKTKRYVFCVRAQDKHTGGPWSHWTQCLVNKQNVKC
eukprot:superscaffoldBa00002025_g12912